MEWSDYLRFVIALAFVLGLIGLLAWAARRSGIVARPTVAGGTQRLAVLEVRPVDAKHRLVLIRRDDTEHLIMLGANSDLLIEGPIVGNVAAKGDES